MEGAVWLLLKAEVAWVSERDWEDGVYIEGASLYIFQKYIVRTSMQFSALV